MGVCGCVGWGVFVGLGALWGVLGGVVGFGVGLFFGGVGFLVCCGVWVVLAFGFSFWLLVLGFTSKWGV